MKINYNRRLLYGTRTQNLHYLPEDIWIGIRILAKRNKISMSRVIEECLIDYFGLSMPRYKNNDRKNHKDR